MKFLVSSEFALSCFANQLDPQVLDEADRLLDSEFGVRVDEILKTLPIDLYSATLTDKVARLQRANASHSSQSTNLREVSSLYVDVILSNRIMTNITPSHHFLQYYLLCALIKEAALVSLWPKFDLVFVQTMAACQK
jgi:ATP-dependent RNA helicase DDX47/RRP3